MHYARVAFLIIGLTSAATAQTEGLTWPTAVDRLMEERSLAETCVGLLKARADSKTLQSQEGRYDLVKAKADGVIAGLKVAVVAGGQPEGLPTLKADIEDSANGLKQLCDLAITLGPREQGKRGVWDAIAGSAIGPIVTALSEFVSHLVDNKTKQEDLVVNTILTELEAAKWPVFGSVSPLQ